MTSYKQNFIALLFVLIIIAIPSAKVSSQHLHIGQSAPSFVAASTKGVINFPDDYFNRWKIIFSHPADFTPVCTSEILALADKQDDFKKLKTVLLVVSTDGLNSHISWVKSIESIQRDSIEGVTIDFPLIADTDLSVSKKYNLLNADTLNRKDLRSVVYVDPDNKIRAILTYPDNIGRNINELIRLLIALQTTDRHNVLTPADWNPGDDVLIESPKTIEESEKLKARNRRGYYNLTWYMWFRRL
jgi:peroxiredoxin 2/4